MECDKIQLSFVICRSFVDVCAPAPTVEATVVTSRYASHPFHIPMHKICNNVLLMEDIVQQTVSIPTWTLHI